MVLDACGKLIAHLRGHERVGDMVLLEIIVQGDEVESDFFGNDMHRCTAGQRGIHVHHAGIETIAGVGGHLVLGLQAVETLIPVAEGHQIGMGELATLGNTRGTRGVEHDEKGVG